MKSYLVWGHDDGPLHAAEVDYAGATYTKPSRSIWRWHRGEKAGKSMIVTAANRVEALSKWRMWR